MKKITDQFKIYFEKLLSFLRVRATAAGLEIGDRVIRLVIFNKKVWQMHAVRLEPGVMEDGKIKDRAALIAALVALRAKLGRGAKDKKTNVVVCLSSVQMYTQVFNLPVVRGQSFDEAVQLNLQMASPLDAKESHSGWEIVGKDAATLRTEILSAFVAKEAVDEMVDTIFEAGFLAMALESRSLAFARVLRVKGAGVDPAKPYLLVDIDNAGMDFLIIRNGALYFEYATPWHDLMDDKGEVAPQKFETALAGSLRQVLNFYNQHWTEPLVAVILSAVALEAEAERVMAVNSPLPVVKLTLVMGQPISSEWLVALGCSLRGTELTARDQEINLLGEDSQDRFHEEQFIRFLHFWSTNIPIALAVLVLTFVGAHYFLTSTESTLAVRSGVTLPPGESAEVTNLKAQAASFDQDVALAASAENMQVPTSPFLQTILALATANNITVSHISVSNFASAIQFSGSANDQTSVEHFKDALTADPRFGQVNLPLTAVQTNGAVLTFSMSFIFNPAIPAPAPASTGSTATTTAP